MSDENDVIKDILSYYEDHSSIKAIKEKHAGKSFTIPPATEEDIGDIIDKLHNKTTGIDKISAKLVKLSKDVIVTPLTKAINSSILKINFPTLMKYGKMSPIYNTQQMVVGYIRPITGLPRYLQFSLKSKRGISSIQ